MKIDKVTEAGRAEDYLSPLPHEVEVVQGSWRIGDTVLVTYDVASCLVLVAHNTITGKGLLGHFSSVSSQAQFNPQLVNEQIDAALFDQAVHSIPALGPPQATQVWLGGGAVSADRSQLTTDNILADRQYGEASIHAAAARDGMESSAVTVNWNTSGHVLYVNLDCQNGSLIVKPVEETE